ncbi:MAG TPA: hypothetical protein VKB35_13575 [Ktedonobacteraceae bacterium]|nr:hypothetical protein [Ktedonobacteraceae bacterium]
MQAVQIYALKELDSQTCARLKATQMEKAAGALTPRGLSGLGGLASGVPHHRLNL